MFADREDRDVHLRQAESCLISSEIGYRLAQIEKDVLLVRQALERVRAKLVSGETT